MTADAGAMNTIRKAMVSTPLRHSLYISSTLSSKTYTISPRYIIPAVFSVKQERNMFGDLFLFSELSIISDVFWYEKRMRSGFYRILAAPCPISEELIFPTAWLPEAACTIMVLVSLMKAAVLVVCQLL